MKTSQILAVTLLFLLTILSENAIHAQNYTGNFQTETDELTITLSLRQDGNGQLTGTLKSSNGTVFSLQGNVSEGVGIGVVSNDEGALFFEAYLDGNDLTLSLISPDQDNMPDYDSARYLVLSRGYNQMQTQTQAQPQTQPSYPVPAPGSPGQQSGTQQSTKPATTLKAGTDMVKDDINGYSFTVPADWVYQKAEGQILLGSHTIPGVISVFPHQARSMQELQGLMQQGIQEEGVFLSVGGGLQQHQQGMLRGTYNGSVQGETALGYGIGILSPHGGGMFVLAVSTPEKLGEEIKEAADYLAANTIFSKRKAGSPELIRHFSGEWAWTNGYRSEWLTFFPDGTYSDQSEASYSGNMSDGSGNVSGNWGVAGQDSNRGRWNIQGTIDQGVITVINPDGSQTTYKYSVFVERGEKYYREYMMNGYHYRKQKDF